MERNLNRLRLSELALDVGRQQIVDQLARFLAVRGVRDKRHHVRHDWHPQSVPVWQHHCDRLAVFNGDVDVVSIGQAHFSVATSDQITHNGVAIDNAHAVRL